MSASREADAAPPARMTRAEFRAWAEGRTGRWELVEGVVFRLSAERAGHARAKASVRDALRAAIRAAGVACEALPDGMTVEVGDNGDFVPDAVVACGPRTPNASVVAVNPIVVVEVLSPATAHVDTSRNLDGYLRRAGVRHYLIVDWDRRTVVHHHRPGEGEGIATSVLRRAGPLRLDPPGIAVDIADFFAELDEPPPE